MVAGDWHHIFGFCLLSCPDSKWVLNVNGAPKALASALAIDIQNPFGVYLRTADKGWAVIVHR